MNTIKIYLEESGTVADLRKDFNIYQGQYQSKLLNVYVPTSIVATKCDVKIGIKHLDRSGIIKQSRNFAMRYVKDVTYNGVDYALFERLLPKEFTMYVGTDQNKPRLIINVVDITDETNPTVLSVITCQECDLDVIPSANLYNDETLDPTALEEINAELNALNQEMAQKQDKTDILLETTSKTVVGGINENKQSINTNTTNIASNSEQIAGLRNDISDLTARVESGENDIGQMEGDTLPTSAQLNQFVEDTVIRATTVGDVVIFVLDSDPKRNYKFTYYQSGWAGYELTTVSKADNNIYGLLKGTYGIDSANEVLLDINNGEVLHIWVQDGATYRDLKEYLGANKTNIANIINGTLAVGKAASAEKDGEGNNIVNTYLTQSAGATKEYVKDYAMPKQFSNVYFITAEGYDGLEGTNEDPIFTETTSSVGEHQIIKGNNVSSDLAMTLDADFEVSITNAYQNTFWLETSADCNVEFKLITQYQKEGQQWTNLNIELSEQYSLTADTPTRVDFSSQFLSLGDTTVELVEGDKIRQILSVRTQTSDSITFDIYSYSTYPSTFNLLVSNYTPLGATTVYVDGSPVASWNANNKLNIANPTATGSISVNRKANSTTGNKSVAMGNNVTASGECSVALGLNTTASNICAVALGNATTASGTSAIAEGDTTTASGTASHAEGQTTTASGLNAHSEGRYTEASGYHSHAQGLGTKATRQSQMTLGEYNTTETGLASSRGQYAVIVGNGTADDARSNAMTVDWNGNQVLAGTLQSTGFKDGNNANFKAVLPDTSGWNNDQTLATLNMVYPVGSIYLSVNSTDPSTLFGGTWEQLKDRFLLGAGDTYSNGTTSGAATHSHELKPSHVQAEVTGTSNKLSFTTRSSVNWNSDYQATGITTGSQVYVSQNYGAGVHGDTENANNMPPYLVVYMWKRTA